MSDETAPGAPAPAAAPAPAPTLLGPAEIRDLAELLGGSEAASALLEAGGVAPTSRGEELSVHDYLRVAHAWVDREADGVPPSLR